MSVRAVFSLFAGGILAAAVTPFRPPQDSAITHTLTVVVTGTDRPGGVLGAALFASPAGFPDGTAPAAALLHRHTTAAADTFVFRDVAPGRYALAVQHDLNGNGTLDRNLLGVPREPWGVSGNVRHSVRAPRFDEASFDLRGDLRIDVRVAR